MCLFLEPACSGSSVSARDVGSHEHRCTWYCSKEREGYKEEGSHLQRTEQLRSGLCRFIFCFTSFFGMQISVFATILALATPLAAGM